MKKILVFILVALVALALVACGDESATTTLGADTTATPGADTTATPGADTTATPGVDTTAAPGVDTTATPGVDTTATPGVDTTATPGTETTDTPNTTETPAIEPIAPTTEVAGDSGKITVTASDVKTGLLLDIGDANKYDTDVNTLFTGDENTLNPDAEEAGFTRISTTFRTLDNKHFLRTEALKALEAMIQSFDAAAGTEKPFRVEGYTAAAGDNLADALVTGYVLKIRTLVDNATYGLNYNAFKVLLDGEEVTYDKWMEANAAKYGFVYEGLVGAENSAAGQLRYVGTIHAAGIAAAGSLKNYTDGIKDGTITSVTVGNETWTLLYKDVTADTEIEVGKGAAYTVSGDNLGGVIVAYKAAK